MRHNRPVLPPVGDRPVGDRTVGDRKDPPVPTAPVIRAPVIRAPVFRARRRTVVLAAAAAAGVLLIVVLVAGWAGGGKSDVTDVDGSTSAVLYTAGNQPVAPEFTGTTLTGSRLSLSAYRGQVVVLNFWGSW